MGRLGAHLTALWTGPLQRMTFNGLLALIIPATVISRGLMLFGMRGRAALMI